MVEAIAQQVSPELRRNVYVGNDVVDLGDPEARAKSRDLRFVDRVLCPGERAQFDTVVTDETLWSFWSAKESAYKVLQKAFDASPTPRALEVRSIRTLVTGTQRRSGACSATGWVAWRRHRVWVRWYREAEYVHCVAWFSRGALLEQDNNLFSRVERLTAPRLQGVTLTPAEAVSARNPASAAARQLAKELVVAQKSPRSPVLSLDALEILRQPGHRAWGPPQICIDEHALTDWDVSLSHHGRFAAAAVSQTDDRIGSRKPEA